MYDLRFNAVDLYAATSPLESNRHYVLYQKAFSRFSAARRAAVIERAKSLLLGHARRLLSLAALPSSQVCGRHYGGIKCVSLNQICGSMNRTGDFDQHFHPLADRLRDRWVSVAMANSQDVPLPPVSLVQVGGCYFVEDGHHRISVARAMGQTAVEAEVTVWDVRGPLPWERQSAARPVVQVA
jgi:hypothetical protein